MMGSINVGDLFLYDGGINIWGFDFIMRELYVGANKNFFNTDGVKRFLYGWGRLKDFQYGGLKDFSSDGGI